MATENKTEKYIGFYHHPLGKQILKKEIEMVEKKLTTCRNIVSVGCGPAFHETGLQICHPDKNIVGIDCSVAMLKYAPPGITVVQGNAQNLPVCNRRCDALLFMTSLEFITDDIQAIKEAYRVLKKRGVLLAVLLNTKSHYFKEEYNEKKSYIRENIIHVDSDQIKKHISSYFHIHNREYFLGIAQGKLFDTRNPLYAALEVITARKHG